MSLGEAFVMFVAKKWHPILFSHHMVGIEILYPRIYNNLVLKREKIEIHRMFNSPHSLSLSVSLLSVDTVVVQALGLWISWSLSGMAFVIAKK